jgi:amino acid transporter
MFFTVSGGPYGLEPLLNYVSGHTALLLIFLIPLLWSLPAVLMVLELNGMMPVNGGYYQWVKTALGLRAGFLEGWWSWIFTFVDLAIYPVLFVQYLCFFFPEIEPYRVTICLAMVWCCAGLNLLGIVPVGRSSVVLGIAVLVPFIILFARGLTYAGETSIVAAPAPEIVAPSAFAMAMFTTMWNYLGWDNGSPFAGEVDQPVRSYGRSLVVVFLLIVAAYGMAIFTAHSTGMNPELLNQEGFPALGMRVSGAWLGAMIAFGGMASALGLFLSILLSISRVPAAMAEDGLFPHWVSRVHPRLGVPHLSILLCAAIVSGMVLWSLGDLLIIDVTLYSAALFLEFASLIALRIRAPEFPRPFRIPLNVAGLVVMTAIPAVCLGVALWGLLSQTDFHAPATLFAAGTIMSGPIAWAIVVLRNPKIRSISTGLPAVRDVLPATSDLQE